MGNREVIVRSQATVLTIFMICLLGCSSALIAADSDGGRAAADFLRIGYGARAAGMGGAFTAVSEGAEAVYWNPAAVVGMDSFGEVALGHFVWYQDISVEHGAAAFSLGDDLTLGAAIAFLDYGTIAGYADDGSATNDLISAYDISGCVTLSAQITDQLSAGVSAKLVNQKLDDISGSGAAFDAGLKFTAGDFDLAAVVANVGPALEFDGTREPLPAVARLGLAWNASDLALLTLDFEKPERGDITFRQGIELDFSGQYFLRAGLRVAPESPVAGLSASASFGGGLRLGGTEINYAFTPSDQFSSSLLHRFSVVFTIGN